VIFDRSSSSSASFPLILSDNISSLRLRSPDYLPPQTFVHSLLLCSPHSQFSHTPSRASRTAAVDHPSATLSAHNKHIPASTTESHVSRPRPRPLTPSLSRRLSFSLVPDPRPSPGSTPVGTWHPAAQSLRHHQITPLPPPPLPIVRPGPPILLPITTHEEKAS
jgi:hypothetical protein